MADLPEHLRGTPTGTARVSRQVLEEHQRERVIALVTPIFAKRGYQATTVDDLLASGKVGVGNFYSLFDGKEDCFLAAYDQSVAAARERVATAARRGEGWAESAYLGLAGVAEALVEDRFAARLVLVEAQSAGPTALARYNALLDEGVGWLAGGRTRHPHAAGLPPRFEQAAIAGLAYYLQQCLLGVGPSDPQALHAETAAVVLEPIIGAVALRRLRGALTPTT